MARFSEARGGTNWTWSRGERGLGPQLDVEQGERVSGGVDDVGLIVAWSGTSYDGIRPIRAKESSYLAGAV